MVSAILKDIMFWFYLYPVRFCIQKQSLGFTYLTGKIGGRLLYRLGGNKNKIMREELLTILKEKEKNYSISDIIKKAFENYCLSEMEVLLYPVLNRRLINKMIRIEGLHNLDSALSHGKGVVLLQAHFGAFQLTMPAIGYSGYKMSQISAPASVWKEMMDGGPSEILGRVMDYKAQYEQTLPVKHIQVTTSLKPAFSTLKRNEILGVTIDGGGGKRLFPVKFLGRTAQFQGGGVEIALRTGAIILPTFIIRGKDSRHRLVIHEPVRGVDGKTTEENIGKILEEFTGLLEDYFYKHPCHYTYSLYLKRSRAHADPYPFFMDYPNPIRGMSI